MPEIDNKGIGDWFDIDPFLLVLCLKTTNCTSLSEQSDEVAVTVRQKTQCQARVRAGWIVVYVHLGLTLTVITAKIILIEA